MTYKYLFIDDLWVEQTYALHRVLGEVKKDPLNPIVRADQPWEKGVKLYGTVLKINGSYRMWYQMLNLRETDLEWATGVGYAESKDGLHWTKPMIGIEHPRYGATNVVQQSSARCHLCSPSVLFDGQSYTMMFYDAMLQDDLDEHGSPFDPNPAVPGWTPVTGEGMFISSSVDGINWKRAKFPNFNGPNDVVALTYVKSKGEWLTCFKTSYREDRHHRVIATASSKNLIDWIQNGIVLEPDHNDPFGTEFYGMTCFDYYGNYIGLLNVYHNSPDSKAMDIQLAVSHDSFNWTRAVNRQTFISLGPSGTWDGGGIFVSSQFVIDSHKEDTPITLYYSAINTKHDDFRYKEWSIGRLFIRRDGFAALEARFFPGTLVTKPVKINGNCLNVNADITCGEIEISIFDFHTGLLIESLKKKKFSSKIIHRYKLSKTLTDTEVFFVFRLIDAKIYAFYFSHI